MRSRNGLVLVALVVAAAAWATTWAPIAVECPVCHTKNEFAAVMSYGSYIYRWPSKLQLVFWPFTDANVLYSCKKCHYTAFMSDFANVPSDKGAAIRSALEKEKLDYSKGYARIPMSQRLALAEKAYAIWGRDDEFWCHFYRVYGYHLAEEGKVAEAAAARQKALALAQKLLADTSRKGQRKELLVISGSMRELLGDSKGAAQDFTAARGLTFKDPRATADQGSGYDHYLADLAAEHLEHLTGPSADAGAR